MEHPQRSSGQGQGWPAAGDAYLGSWGLYPSGWDGGVAGDADADESRGADLDREMELLLNEIHTPGVRDDAYDESLLWPAAGGSPLAGFDFEDDVDVDAAKAGKTVAVRKVDDPRNSSASQRAMAETLINWIEEVVKQYGGRVIGANLGSALANSNSAMYRTMKSRFGGLTPLLAKYPHKFTLENDPPFNHVSIKLTCHDEDGQPIMPKPSVMESKSLEEIEGDIVQATRALLEPIPHRSMKAVELANMLRARMGTDALAVIRERHGGLLVLLERATDTFRVSRIPKNDTVTLIANNPPPASRTTSNCSTDTSGSSGSSTAASTSLEEPGARGHDVMLSDMENEDQAGVTSGAMHYSRPRTYSNGATRCLHVGNVSTSIKEAELWREFAKYGRVEALRMVSQKGRRFAFVNYATAEEAEHAKACLSKQHMWRSNISFAKRETIAVSGVPDGVTVGSAVGTAAAVPHGGTSQVASHSANGLMASSSYVSSSSAMPTVTASSGTVTLTTPAVQPSWAPAAAPAAAEPKKTVKGRNLVPSRHLWVGNVAGATKEDIMRLFRPFGEIEDINFLKDRRCAFIDFYRLEDCVRAFQTMQSVQHGDDKLELGYGRSRSGSQGAAAESSTTTQDDLWTGLPTAAATAPASAAPTYGARSHQAAMPMHGWYGSHVHDVAATGAGGGSAGSTPSVWPQKGYAVGRASSSADTWWGGPSMY